MKKKKGILFLLVCLYFILSIAEGASFAWECGQECPSDIISVINGEWEACEQFQLTCEIVYSECAKPFEFYVLNVYGVCALDHGSSGSGNVNQAKELLIRNCFFTKDDFDGVEFKWCTPLELGASGMVPAPDQIVLSRNYRFTDARTLAPLIGHEMVHVKQIRRLGFDEFACQYSGELFSGKGYKCKSLNSATGNFLECEAEIFENRIISKTTDEPDPDNDGVGNACDPNDDNDGLSDEKDNCPSESNFDQKDTDYDRIGDACDTDDDNDGLSDEADNCPLKSNFDQKDTDYDRIGDACDTDDDNDGLSDGADNCPLKSNIDQKDTDHDKIGDACDNCIDGQNLDQRNSDQDTFGDVCDNCSNYENSDQKDTDYDGVGDVCDNCPFVSNSLQTDNDCDKIGDACDYDFFAPGCGIKKVKVPAAIDKRPDAIQKPDWPIKVIEPDEKIRIPDKENPAPVQ